VVFVPCPYVLAPAHVGAIGGIGIHIPPLIIRQHDRVQTVLEQRLKPPAAARLGGAAVHALFVRIGRGGNILQLGHMMMIIRTVQDGISNSIVCRDTIMWVIRTEFPMLNGMMRGEMR
jgi:hypothetical protein